MRVLTYNLLSGERDDGARLLQATALLQAARPDVLALNECALLAQDHNAKLYELATALGMQAMLALAPSGFHVALLVREALIERVDTLARGFTHAAVVAQLTVCSQKLQVIATHLDPYSPAQRSHEAALLAAQLSSDRPSLLLGDLNTISPFDTSTSQPEHWPERYRRRHLDGQGQIDTRAIQVLQGHHLVDVHAALHPQTTPTRPTASYIRPDRPSQRLDYIFASPALASTARACAPYQHEHAQTASDHVPLYADFSPDPPTASPSRLPGFL